MAAVASLLAACGTTDNPTPQKTAPTIALRTTGTGVTTITPVVTPGTRMTVAFTANKGSNNLNNVRVRVYGGLTLTGSYASLANGTKTVPTASTATFNDSVVVSIPATPLDPKVTIIVSDGISSSDSIVIRPTGIATFRAVRLFTPLSDNTARCFLATTTNQTYTPLQGNAAGGLAIARTVDVGYFYGATLNATLVTPNLFTENLGFSPSYRGNLDWLQRNATQFKATTAAYASLTTKADLKAAFDNGTDAASSTNQFSRYVNLSVGNLVAFKTQAGRHAVAEVKGLNRTTGTGGYIELDYKVEF